MSYSRPQNVREIAPRSVSSLPNSTQKLSRKRGRVSRAECALSDCLKLRVQFTSRVAQRAERRNPCLSLRRNSIRCRPAGRRSRYVGRILKNSLGLLRGMIYLGAMKVRTERLDT